jgi:MFS transporter, LPLT family, lysophospholipid transporter
MGAGHSIAVQNFNENLSILLMTGTYALLAWAHLSIYTIIALFGIFVSAIMYLIMRWHAENQRQHDDVGKLEDRKH